ncbi:YSIRK-type signal peptide-containing protein [Lactobacillus crispatus]|uniref:YSIRK-type signal peptide-containing protein n=1 Tax=Lactobacillus crispatus TaxID=47770 RepID=UPI0004093318|nr:YSIRK-type signal peptide-containing protein [Lactobacillus crispatus]
MKYFRNDKLDLVNKEKQRFGFRKLSSGKIASVLLGVTIFGSFALNGQVVKADTTTDGSQTTAVVDEAKNKQTDEEEGQDTSAQKAGSGEESHEAQTGTVTPGTTSGSEAETGKTKADSTGTDTPNANRGIQPLIKTVRGLLLR